MKKNRRCYLDFTSSCQGKITREHYISHTILRQIGSVSIQGLDWQEKCALASVGRESLTAKILCEKHNATLGELDSVAGMFFETLNNIDKNPLQVEPLTRLSGHDFEKWLLKLTVGLVSGPMQKDRVVSDDKTQILLTNRWPDEWGFYVKPSSGVTVFEKSLEIELRKNPKTNEILALKLYFAGFECYLLLGVPDNPSAFGFHRPRGLIFDLPSGERKVEFLWQHESDQAIIYTKTASTKQRRIPWGK